METVSKRSNKGPLVVLILTILVGIWSVYKLGSPLINAVVNHEDWSGIKTTLTENLSFLQTATRATGTEELEVLSGGPVDRRNVSAWIHNVWDVKLGISSLQSNASTIGEVNPVWYHFSPSGDPEEPFLLVAKEEDVKSLLNAAAENGVAVIPTLTNVGPEASETKWIVSNLEDPESRSKLVQQVVRIGRTSSYNGVDLNFESISEKDLPAFASFYVDVARALHKHRKTVSVSINATHLSAESRNVWAKVASEVDGVKVLLYPENHKRNLPGPVASTAWSKRSLESYLEFLPKEKVSFAMPLYGQCWSGASEPEGTMMFKGRPQIPSPVYLNHTVYRDKEGNPHVKSDSGDTECWFEDAISIQSKVEMAQALGVTRFSFWRLGGEDPRVWEMLQNK